MVVLKFGGSSVKDAERIRGLGELLKARFQGGDKMTIVVSALGGATDALICLATSAPVGNKDLWEDFRKLAQRHYETIEELFPKDGSGEVMAEVETMMDELKDIIKGIQLLKEASPRTMDLVQSFGERLSATIIAAYLTQIGIPSTFTDARSLIQTDDSFGCAKADIPITESKILNAYKDEDSVRVVTGFIGSTADGVTTTLGRGGSDYTAAILAACLRADMLEIWTDVDGVLTADPRIVENARTIEQLSYEEAMELSHFGAKVIYPPTIQPALARGIPIRIKNTYRPEHPGTLIGEEKGIHPASGMTGLSAIRDVALLTLAGTGLVGVPGTSARFFGALGRAGVNVIMITQASSEHSICIAIGQSEVDTAVHALEEEFDLEIERGSIRPVRVEKDLSVIAMVGEGMRQRPGVAGRLFSALGRNGVNIVAVAQGSSEMNVTFVIQGKDEAKALELVHDAFFIDQKNKLHVFMIGVGLIGGTLLEQIAGQRESLKKGSRLDIRISGLANSRKMLFDAKDIDPSEWRSRMEDEGRPSDFDGFVKQMLDMNLPNSVFVDCTAHPSIKQIYPALLSNSIAIATANKVAASSTQKEFDDLIRLSSRHAAPFMNETNVGAGLPVIATLRHQVESGDCIQSIQAVISGSLSYIFNHFDGERPFVELVKEAREKGFTEPDPREDLSGNDIKRKIIILARVAGFRLEPDEVEVESLLPKESMDAPSIEDFFTGLPEAAQKLEDKVREAKADGHRLRYIASFEEGKAKVSLETVDEQSPFYNLASTDNMILIHSDRYAERPLVVSGPGAGADVTAAGVFAELIQLGSRIDA